MEAILVAPILAVCSSIAWGGGDFAGGLAAKNSHVLRVVSISAPASLVLAVALLPLLGGSWSSSTLVWGAASGIASAAAFVLLYWSLAVGPMSVLSPIAAIVSAIIPFVVGLAAGERLRLIALAGIPLALLAIALISAGPSLGENRATRRAVLVAISAGAAIGLQLVCLAQAPHDSGIAPIVVGRTATSILLVGAALVSGSRRGTAWPRADLAASAGALDSLANAAFLVAVRHGELAIVGVITALYPATTVLLARLILGERLVTLQVAGLLIAVVAVALLAQA